MKNVAKCDTWCELQNPVNHRVFERKLRPRPSAKGTPVWASRIASPPPPPPFLGRRRAARGGQWPPVRRRAAGLNADPVAANGRDEWWCTRLRIASRPRVPRELNPQNRRAPAFRTVATPDQAGLPAEFKHINKRRKRNLQGFP